MTQSSSTIAKTIIPDFRQTDQEKFSLKIATTDEEIIAAQKLRYEVFYEEMGAHPTPEMLNERREIEAFDPICDHLLVIDNNAPEESRIVGTYRILTTEKAARHGSGLYTETEFNIDTLRAKSRHIMEVSRSCVKKPYRDQLVINLLWKGIAAYVAENNIEYLVGVPSLPGTDIEPHLETLAYLQQNHLADPSIRPHIHPQFRQATMIDPALATYQKKAFSSLSPLIKGYLRVGAMIGDGIYVDKQFNCIDICIVAPVDETTSRYFNRFRR